MTQEKSGQGRRERGYPAPSPPPEPRLWPDALERTSLGSLSPSILKTFLRLALPFLPLGAIFGFVPLPPHFYLALAGLVIGYLVSVEVVKARFFADRL